MKLLLILCAISFSQAIFAQTYYVHPGYRTGYFWNGQTMASDIPGYQSVQIQSDSAGYNYAIISDTVNIWRKFGNTEFNVPALFAWYNVPTSDNLFNNSTTVGKWYTTRLKDNGYNTTNAIVMETTNKPTEFAPINTIKQITPDPVYSNQNIQFEVNMAGPRSPEEFVFLRFTYNNWASSDILQVFFSGLTDTIGNATIIKSPGQKTIQYYALSSTFDAWNFVASDYDLITLNRGMDNGNFYSVQVFDPLFNVTVRFRMDMKNTSLGPNGPHLVGTFNNWDSTATPMTLLNGTTYFADVNLDTNEVVEYTFLQDTTGADTVPLACANLNSRRELAVPNANTTLPVVCFSSCSPCVYPDSVFVTFFVNANGPAPGGMFLVGSWNNFQPIQMVNYAATNYSVAVKLDTTTNVYYYFQIGATPEVVQGNCTQNYMGMGNYRFLPVPEVNTNLPLICFSSCYTCALKNKVTITFKVDLSNTPIGPGLPHVIIDDDNYNTFSHLLTPIGNGIYQHKYLVDTTKVLRYKFIRDANLYGAEQVPGACGVYDGTILFDTVRSIIVPEIDTTLPVVCYSSCGPCQPSPLREYTFKVNMTGVPLGPGGPTLAGNFNGWNLTQYRMTQELPVVNGQVIYKVTMNLDTSLYLKYNFFSDTTNAAHEELPNSCSVGGNGKPWKSRWVDLPNVSTVFQPVCFAYCLCSDTNKVKVRFRVDMSNTPLGNSYAHIIGTFNNWDPLADITYPFLPNIYIQIFLLEKGSTHFYRFLRDGSLIGGEIVPAACGWPDGNGGYVRRVDVGQKDTILPVVCYSECDTPCNAIGQKELTFKVDMSQTTIGPFGPHVVWNYAGMASNKVAMINGGNGIYYVSVFVDTATVIEYRFLRSIYDVDAEVVPIACDNANGNRQITMGTNSVILPIVCFGGCTSCGNSNSTDVTFRVDVAQSGFQSGVYLATNKNGFNPVPMNQIGPTLFSLTLNLPQGDTLQYFFLNDIGFGGQEIVPIQCGVLDGNGNFVRELIVPTTALLLPDVCFSDCILCPPPPLSNVTFQVNVSQTNIGTNFMYLAGTFNSWDTTSLQMVNFGNGIWKKTISLDTTAVHQYRFFVGNTFAGSETVNPACAVPDTVGGLSREIAVPENDSTLAAVCLNECINCSPAVSVTFKCDYSKVTIGPGKPHLAGAFNGWSLTATPLDSMGNGVWQKTLLLDSTQTYQYKFLSDTLLTAYEIVPQVCGVNNGGFFNRNLKVPESSVALPLVCFSECGPCIFPDSVDVVFKVDLSNTQPGVGGPHLIRYNPNNFNTTKFPLTYIAGNVWGVMLRLDTMETIQYRFSTGSAIITSETVPPFCGVSNVFHGFVRSLKVPKVDSVLATRCFASCIACTTTPKVKVTFRVDMAQTILGQGGPRIAGSFNNWNTFTDTLKLIGGTTYGATLLLDSTKIAEYKFLNDTGTGAYEIVPVLCSNGNGNRALIVPETDTILDIVCFSNCAACPYPDTVDVTFLVDMVNTPPGPNGVHLAGTFNGWSTTATPMNLVGGTLYSIVLPLDTMLNIEYKFLSNDDAGSYELVPQQCSNINGNRFLAVPETDVVLDTICFATCGKCVIPDSVNITLQVDFTNTPPGPNGPHIAGTFNSWSTTANPLTLINGNVYGITLRLDTTSSIEYKFLSDDNVPSYENFAGPCLNSNGNRSLDIPEVDSVFQKVCFNECDTCIAHDSVLVTLQVDMTNTTIGIGGPHVAGTFNNWSTTATPLNLIVGNIYGVSLWLDTMDNIEYKFLSDNVAGYETVPFACALSNGNRGLNVPEADTTLDVVCFSSCIACSSIDSVNVTFLVDVTGQTFGIGGPHIAGSWNGWSTKTQLTQISGNVYGTTIMIDSSLIIQYKFLTDNNSMFESVPSQCGVPDGFGGFNREFEVPEMDAIIDTVCFSECTYCPKTDSVKVKFVVDMSNSSLGQGGPHIAGTFNNWNVSSHPLTDIGNGCFEIELWLDTTLSIEYKFLNDNNTSGYETVPQACGVPDGVGGYNRFLQVPETDTILAKVCFSECNGCIPIGLVSVNFRVDMSQTAIGKGGPHLAGSFNSWTPIPMTALGNNIYGITLVLDSSKIFQYKFLSKNSLAGSETVPMACGVQDVNGVYNRELVVPNNFTILPIVCFNECGACGATNKAVITFQVDLKNETPVSPHLVGSFNAWDTTATEMWNPLGTKWVCQVVLDTGVFHQYKFLIDSTFVGEEIVPQLCGVPNGLGGYNREIIVTISDSLDCVCYSQCGACTDDSVNVTFQVDMHGAVIMGNQIVNVFIAGTFNNWDPTATPMFDVNSDSIYTVTLRLDSTQTIQYKYLRDNNFGAVENVPGQCGVPDGFGGFNRELVVPEFDITLQEICFNFCTMCFVGVNEILELDIVNVYPNPTDGIFTIDVTGNATDITIAIYDNKGAMLHTTNESDGNKYVYDLSNQPKGIYYIRVLSKNGIVTKKLVIN
ncbi:MAG: T9SS type A sorting domain-containing protein [Bacteroidetes bacterium]|nr:T9SS type A sorting domain-containing protein [Bacteroidota bacterium]